MAAVQSEIRFHSPDDDLDEITREERDNERVLRLMATVIDEEITRKQVCWGLQMSESELSRRLACVDGKRPCFRMLRYVTKHEKTGRLAALIAEQDGYLPPERPDRLTDAEFRARAEEMFRQSGPAGDAMRRGILGCAAKGKP